MKKVIVYFSEHCKDCGPLKAALDEAGIKDSTDIWYQWRIVSAEKEGNDDFDLSLREKEVLIAVAKGKTNKEIADELNISIHTVMTHRKNITSKTGIKSISGLTVYALLNNLVKQEDVN